MGNDELDLETLLGGEKDIHINVPTSPSENKKLNPEPYYTIEQVLKKGGVFDGFIPNYKVRNEQIRLSKAIEKTISNGQTLISEASTGTGKSIAYLVPAIMKPDWKFVVSTGTKALQEQLFNKDIPMLQEAFKTVDKSFKAVLVKGRGNYISIRRFNEFSKNINFDYFQQHQVVDKWLDEKDCTGDFDELDFILDSQYKSAIQSTSDDCEGKDCPFYEQCKYHENKRKAADAKIMVVNHDLLSLDLVLKDKLGYGTLPKYDGIILDECHNLEDTISKYLGFKISHYSVRPISMMFNRYKKQEEKDADYAIADYSELLSEVEASIRKIGKMTKNFLDNFYPDKNEDIMRIRPEHIETMVIVSYTKLKKAINKSYSLLRKLPISSSNSEELLEGIHSKIDSFLSNIDMVYNIEEHYEDFVFWSTLNSNGDVYVETAPIEVDEYLNKMLFSRGDFDNLLARDEMEDTRTLKTVIMTSATVTTNESFSYIKNRLGIEDDANECIVGSPFNYSKQSLFYIPKGLVEPTGNYKNLEAFTRLMAQNVVDLIRKSKGRALILFTSYSEMNKVYELCKNKIEYPLYKQGDYPKAILTQKFESEINSVLFATSSFREGISIEGESLSLLVQDKIPFPVPSEPIIEARIEKMKNNNQDWFNMYYIPIAIIAIKQGFGRLIRTVDDFGVYSLMDIRVLTKGYGGKFLRSLPDMLETRNPDKVDVFLDYVEKIREHRRQKGRRV